MTTQTQTADQQFDEINLKNSTSSNPNDPTPSPNEIAGNPNKNGALKEHHQPTNNTPQQPGQGAHYQNQPPPIYTSFYPPGSYPAHQLPPLYDQHGSVGAFAGRPAFVIDACALNNSPAYIIRGDQGPVYIVSSYDDFLRRRRALLIMSFFILLLPPIVFFLIILLGN